MNKERIRDLAITGGIYDCICDPYDKLNNGDPHSSVMVDLERFARKIVEECVQTLVVNMPELYTNEVAEEDWDKGYDQAMKDCVHHILDHFEIEE